MQGLKKNSSALLKVATTFAVIGTLISAYGCGGGGGGGTVSGITYTGVTTQAIIDENNATEIATVSLDGMTSASNLNVIGAVSANTDPVACPSVIDIAAFIQEVVYKIEGATIQHAAYTGAVVSENETIAGSCGGSFSISFSGDDQTGNFNGSLRFNNFCEQDFTADGNMNLSGNININTGEINYFTMKFTGVNLISGQESISMSGSMDLSMQPSSMRMTMSFVLLDNNLTRSYKYENFVYEYTQGPDFTDMTFTGRFYHQDYGYVNITTQTEIRMYDYDLWPASGTLIATGDMGTKARLSVIDSSTFSVEADTDGDGAYDDYDSGPLTWDSF